MTIRVEIGPSRLQGEIGSRVVTYSLEEAPDAYAALEAGMVEGRAVVVPFQTA